MRCSDSSWSHWFHNHGGVVSRSCRFPLFMLSQLARIYLAYMHILVFFLNLTDCRHSQRWWRQWTTSSHSYCLCLLHGVRLFFSSKNQVSFSDAVHCLGRTFFFLMISIFYQSFQILNDSGMFGDRISDEVPHSCWQYLAPHRMPFLASDTLPFNCFAINPAIAPYTTFIQLFSLTISH